MMVVFYDCTAELFIDTNKNIKLFIPYVLVRFMKFRLKKKTHGGGILISSLKQKYDSTAGV